MDRFGYAKTVDVSVYERNKEAADSENKYVVNCLNTGKSVCLRIPENASDQSDGSAIWKIPG